MSQIRRIAVFTTSLGMAAAGTLAVGTASTAHAAEATAAAAAAPTVQVHVTRKHKVLTRQNLRPGTHKFMITSARHAAFQLAKPAAGYTKAEATRDINRGLNGGKIPALKRFERNIVLLGGVSSSRNAPGVMWANLTVGRYWAVDTNVRRTRVRHFKTLQVAGQRVAGVAHPTTVIRAIDSTKWGPRPKRIDHRGRLMLRNSSDQNHFIILARLAKGKTMKDFKAWIEGGAETPPPIDESAPGLDTGVVSPGHRMTMKYQLPRGRYVLICFWPDADMGGMPHAFMGMYRGIRLI
jgi:hypothetical protein